MGQRLSQAKTERTDACRTGTPSGPAPGLSHGAVATGVLESRSVASAAPPSGAEAGPISSRHQAALPAAAVLRRATAYLTCKITIHAIRTEWTGQSEGTALAGPFHWLQSVRGKQRWPWRGSLGPGFRREYDGGPGRRWEGNVVRPGMGSQDTVPLRTRNGPDGRTFRC